MAHLPYIGWIQVGGVWALFVLHSHMSPCFFDVHAFAIVCGFVWPYRMFNSQECTAQPKTKNKKQKSAMLDFLNPEDMKGTTFRFLFHAFDW